MGKHRLNAPNKVDGKEPKTKKLCMNLGKYGIVCQYPDDKMQIHYTTEYLMRIAVADLLDFQAGKFDAKQAAERGMVITKLEEVSPIIVPDGLLKQ